MSRRSIWHESTLPAGQPAETWALFHHNSKVAAYRAPPDPAVEAARTAALYETLPHALWPEHTLPSVEEARGRIDGADLFTAMTARRSPRERPVPGSVSLETLSLLLHLAYGVTHDETGRGYARAFRAAPSGGALYPLELYVLATRVDGLAAGLYHYQPLGHRLRGRADEDATKRLAACFVQPEYPEAAAFTVLLTALPERSTAKYGDRGYRFVLIEAGHVAQNINLAAGALGLASLNMGGFLDDRLDEALGLDGLLHSTVYCVAVLGGSTPDGAAATP